MRISLSTHTGLGRFGQPDLEAMNSPFELMETLPRRGTSLAFRPLILSNRPEEEQIPASHLDLQRR